MSGYRKPNKIKVVYGESAIQFDTGTINDIINKIDRQLIMPEHKDEISVNMCSPYGICYLENLAKKKMCEVTFRYKDYEEDVLKHIYDDFERGISIIERSRDHEVKS